MREIIKTESLNILSNYIIWKPSLNETKRNNSMWLLLDSSYYMKRRTKSGANLENAPTAKLLWDWTRASNLLYKLIKGLAQRKKDKKGTVHVCNSSVPYLIILCKFKMHNICFFCTPIVMEFRASPFSVTYHQYKFWAKFRHLLFFITNICVKKYNDLSLSASPDTPIAWLILVNILPFQIWCYLCLCK